MEEAVAGQKKPPEGPQSLVGLGDGPAGRQAGGAEAVAARSGAYWRKSQAGLADRAQGTHETHKAHKSLDSTTLTHRWLRKREEAGWLAGRPARTHRWRRGLRAGSGRPGRTPPSRPSKPAATQPTEQAGQPARARPQFPSRRNTESTTSSAKYLSLLPHTLFSFGVLPYHITFTTSTMAQNQPTHRRTIPSSYHGAPSFPFGSQLRPRPNPSNPSPPPPEAPLSLHLPLPSCISRTRRPARRYDLKLKSSLVRRLFAIKELEEEAEAEEGEGWRDASGKCAATGRREARHPLTGLSMSASTRTGRCMAGQVMILRLR